MVVLDLFFPLMIASFILYQIYTFYYEFFKVKRKQNVDLIPLYVKLDKYRRNGVKNSTIMSNGRKW